MARYRKHKEIYRAGDFKLISDESGFTVMASQTRVTWEGYRVLSSEWDPKHPQLIIYPHEDKISVDNPRPESDLDSDLLFGEGNANDL